MKFFPHLKKWDYCSIILITLTVFILIYRWEMFPKFIDIYYHFSVVKNFDFVNGLVIHDYWEYAPAGRPHLYPPLFHLIILLFMKSGINTELLMKFTNLKCRLDADSHILPSVATVAIEIVVSGGSAPSRGSRLVPSRGKWWLGTLQRFTACAVSLMTATATLKRLE